jgi:hypothetical protein
MAEIRQVIECRATGRGASTHARVLREPATVREFNRSRSGNHWSEEVTVGEGGLVFVKDISNSGKHSCYCVPELDLAEVEQEFGGLPCDLPARLHEMPGDW